MEFFFKVLPNAILTIPNHSKMFFGNVTMPYNSLNSPSSPFYDILGFTRDFVGTQPMYVHVHRFLGTVNWTPYGPNGYFSGTFWPKPSLLGLLRSLIFLTKSLKTTLFDHFWILGARGRASDLAGPRSAQERPKRPKNVFWA